MLFLARTGVGKTWWALNVVANNPDTPAVFFQLEMHSRYLLKRLAGVYTGTPTKNIEHSLVTDGWSPAIEKTVQDFPKLQFMDQTGIGIPDMLVAVDDYRDTTGEAPKLIVVDFVTLVRAYGLVEGDSTVKLVQGLKDFARESDAVVVALHQVHRGTAVKRRGSDQSYVDEGHRPLTKSSGSYGGEWSPDYMVGAFRPSLDPEMPAYERMERSNDFRMQFLKTRGDEDIDPYNAVQHHWDQPTGRISEIDWSLKATW